MTRPGWLAVGAATAALAATGALPAVAGVAAVLAAAVVLMACARRAAAAALCVGALLIVVRVAVSGPQLPAAAGLVDGQRGRFLADVASVGSPREGEQRAVLRLLLDDGASASAYASLPRYPPIVVGERLVVEGSLRPAPTDSGFGEYLARQRIGSVMDVRSFEPASDVPALEAVRHAVDERLAVALPEPQAGLASALLVGLRERVDRGVADSFTVAGVSHVVAISGWNIALVGALISTLCRRLPRRPRSLVIVVAVAAYTLVAGASASVVRAALMAGAALAARESGRRGAGAAVLGLAATAMLLVEPANIGDPGYRLSVAATAGLLAWSAPLGARLTQTFPRLPAWLSEALAVSLAAQAATLPLVLLDFGRLSLVAPIANLVIAPVVAPAMAAAAASAVAGVGVGLEVPPLVTVIGSAAGAIVLGLMIAIAAIASAVPFASVELPDASRPFAAALCAAAVFGLGNQRARWALGRAIRFRRPSTPAARPKAPARAAMPSAPPRLERLAVRFGIASAGCALAGLVLVGASRPPAVFAMTVLDVGQGDAILLEGPRGGRILVDAGPDPDRLLLQLDARLPTWDRRIDLAILTHPHEDHVAGLAMLLERYRVRGVGEPGMRGPGPGYAAFAEELERRRVPRRVVGAGDRLRLDGVMLDVRWPPRGSVPVDPPDTGTGINNVSIALDARFGQRRYLLNGDVEEEVDPSLLAGSWLGPVDVLKVAHHGSRTASTDAFLAAARPRVAVISAGAGNPYGHPSPDTIERLRSAGARVLRTDRDGSVRVATDGRGLSVSTSGARAAGDRRGTPVRRVALASLGFACSPPASSPLLATIGSWPSQAVARRSPSSASSSRAAGSSPMSRPSPRSPPSLPAA